jgi:hypothetical protein
MNLFWRTCEYCEEEFLQHVDCKNSENPIDAICDKCYEAEFHEHISGYCGGDCIVCDDEARHAAAKRIQKEATNASQARKV